MVSDPTLLTIHEAAKMALKEQRYHDALKHLERAIGYAPNDVVAYTMSGIAHQRLGHNSQALNCFEKAYQLDVKDAVACFNLGQMHHLMGEDEQAAAWLAECLELDPNHKSARELLEKCNV